MEPGPDELRWQWVLSLRNRTNSQIGLLFLTSNYGFVLIRQEGRTIHSTLEGSLQAVTYRTLAPRETYVCALPPSTLDLPPGRYEVLAKVQTYPRATIARRTLKISGG